MTIDTNVSRRHAAILVRPSPKPGKLVIVEFIVVDRQKVIVLRIQRISIPEQQPSSTIETIDQKRLA
jgi:hypothetical protein